ncbi:MAG: Mu-like prophage major head subunit gpT family protein [Treponema sp.]|jgi:phage major head subunit gpT-like protein|nr:Mu-like prophage major head subunit gpT family protein [Treponema sp.]
MIITNATLQALRTMVRGEFATQMAVQGANSLHQALATVINSTTAQNTYGWLGQFPQMREWIGDRVIKNIKEASYTIVNRLFESTLGVKRTDIEDDNLGIYRPLIAAMVKESLDFLDRNISSLLSGGFANLCYDGQNFFDVDHPVYPNTDGTGAAVLASNVVGSVSATGAPWFLLSLTGALKPLILQQRSAPEMDEITDTKNDTVFIKDQYLYGIRYRGNFGYGFWQQAVASKAALTVDNYQAARLAMQTFKRDGGDPLGVRPTHLVVDPTNEAAGRALLEMQFNAAGGSNPNFHTAGLIVSPWLAGPGVAV